MAVKRQGEKPVTILAVMLDNIDMVDTGKTSRKKGKTVRKPKPVLDKGMAGVRTEYDQQLASYPLMPCYLKTY